MRVLLISTYEMGRQPFGLASPAAWLEEAGVDVRCLDVAREPFREDLVTGDVTRDIPPADLVAFHLPMHTATRLAVPLVRRIRALAPHLRLCGYGLYAPLNADLLRELGVDVVLGAEYEAELVRLATGRSTGVEPGAGLPRLDFRVPDRSTLPPLSRYASVRQGPQRRVAGYTEASRGCKHRCRHCPVVPVYDGRFRVVPVEVVIGDIAQQVDAGAQHITFGDPDFFNGVGHATTVVLELARRFPGVTYDVTIKVEHLLRHRSRLADLAATGCLFVTSAFESFDDRVLARLDKGHTAADIEQAVDVCREAGVVLTPTFVAFTPWTTLAGYAEFLDAIGRLALVDHVAPIQLALRLLVTQGSRLLEHPEIAALTGAFDPSRLTYPWRHPDPDVDALGDEVAALVGRRLTAPRREVFGHIRRLTDDCLGRPARMEEVPASRVEVPYLNEPWYC